MKFKIASLLFLVFLGAGCSGHGQTKRADHAPLILIDGWWDDDYAKNTCKRVE